MINPAGMDWPSYAAAVILVVDTGWSLGSPPPVARWQDFAVGIVRAPGIAQRVLPDPYAFTDWRDWARRVYPMLEGQV